ncbi:MAG TPA: hypothetical protein VGQ83_03070 [Polyangia bacterium]|jgi:hypothetical protein
MRGIGAALTQISSGATRDNMARTVINLDDEMVQEAMELTGLRRAAGSAGRATWTRCAMGGRVLVNASVLLAQVAVALDHGAAVWSLDGHFRTISRGAPRCPRIARRGEAAAARPSRRSAPPRR